MSGESQWEWGPEDHQQGPDLDQLSQMLLEKLKQVFPDTVLIAIIRTVDEDLAKQFDPKFSEFPDEIQIELDRMRLNAITVLYETMKGQS